MFLGGNSGLDELEARLAEVIVLDEVVRSSNSRESISNLGRNSTTANPSS